MVALLPLLRWAPRGEPHPVLVLPGLLASDLSTRVLRTWLGRLGYPVIGWALGRNRGPTQEVTAGLSCRTRDTVWCETPASCATSDMTAERGFSF